MVTSARGPSAADVDHFGRAARAIRAELPDLELCVSLGIMGDDADARAPRRGRRLREPQPEHEPPALPGDLHDAHLRRPRRHGARARSGPDWRRARASSSAWARPTTIWSTSRERSPRSRVESLPVNFLHPIDGTPLGEHEPPHGGTLPARAGALPSHESARRDPRRRRTRAMPRRGAGAGAVRGELGLRGRLSHHRRATARCRRRNDRGPRLPDRGPAGADGQRGGGVERAPTGRNTRGREGRNGRAALGSTGRGCPGRRGRRRRGRRRDSTRTTSTSRTRTTTTIGTTTTMTRRRTRTSERAAQAPATVIRPTLIVGADVAPRNTRSLPTISIPASMSRRLPAMVTSSTGCVELAVLDPQAGGAARVVAGDAVDAEADQLGDVEAARRPRR